MDDEPRLLRPERIPETLWLEDSGTLVLPASLCKIYEDLVKENGLWEQATTARSAGPVGGLTKGETDQHFARSFDGSAARILLALLDPRREVGLTSNTFIRCTAGTSVSFTDAPCGAGAAAAVFLAALAELRSQGVLPRERLDVRLIGAELSEHAIAYAREVLDRLSPALAEQAIFLEFDFVEWDVTCESSTANLVGACSTASKPIERRLLVVANFSGFLRDDGVRDAVRPQLHELLSKASDANSFAVWIEPLMKKAVAPTGLFAWLRRLCVQSWSKFLVPRIHTDDQHYFAEAQFQLPLQPERSAKVRLAVVPFKVGVSS